MFHDMPRPKDPPRAPTLSPEQQALSDEGVQAAEWSDPDGRLAAHLFAERGTGRLERTVLYQAHLLVQKRRTPLTEEFVLDVAAKLTTIHEDHERATEARKALGDHADG
jgi:hypothetical protein